MDYDKPGTLTVCRACAHQANETTVRGRCMDCGERFDAQASLRRGLYDYRLNDNGVHALFQGVMRPSDLAHLLDDRLGLVAPEAFVAMAQTLAAIEARHRLPTLFVEIDMEEVEDEPGSLGTRIRVITALGRELGSLLRPTDVVAYSVGSLWLLLPGSGSEVSARIVSRLEHAIGETFEASIGASLNYYTTPVGEWLAQGGRAAGDGAP